MPDLSHDDWVPRSGLLSRGAEQSPAPDTAAAEAPRLPAIWGERFAWVQRIDSAPAIELGEVMRANGYTVAVLYYHDGTRHLFGSVEIRAWTQALRAQKISVFGAAWVPEAGARSGQGFSPEISAWAAYEDCIDYGWRGFVANGEKAAEQWLGYSGAYVRKFREYAGPDFPLGWSPEPQLDLDHDVFREHNVVICPQAYYHENHYTLGACVEVAMRQGYHPSQVKPLVGIHQASVGPEDPVSLAEGAAVQAELAGCLPPILYPGEQAVFRPELWKALAS